MKIINIIRYIVTKTDHDIFRFPAIKSLKVTWVKDALLPDYVVIQADQSVVSILGVGYIVLVDIKWHKRRDNVDLYG